MSSFPIAFSAVWDRSNLPLSYFQESAFSSNFSRYENERQERAHLGERTIEGIGRKTRPDYRCERLKIIIEFDGLQHYQIPDRIKADFETQKLYEMNGYKVVRIPYFIQLSNSVVKSMFGRDVNQPLFDEKIPSLGVKGKNTPAYCCPAGLKRMAKEFRSYPSQYVVNLKALEDANDEYLTGASLLKEEYDRTEKSADN